MNLVSEIVRFHDEMIGWRHEFHRFPEISHEEKRTAATVASLLRSFDVDEVIEGIGGNGVVGVVRNGNGMAVALRAELDALPITEAGQNDYRSTREGVMHACGHDGHAAMLLGAARYLAEHRNFNGSVILIFQPGEETVSGASSMIRDGLFQKYDVKGIFAVHNWPGMPEGCMCVVPGAVTASVNNFSITITGEGAHAAVPHRSCDPIVAGSAMICGLQTIVSRNMDPCEPAVLSVTSFQSSSTTYNIIPREVELKGTARHFGSELEALFPEKISRLAEHIAAAHGVCALLRYVKACPPTENTGQEIFLARKVASEILGDENLIQYSPVLIGDDFSFFLQERPGVYAFIGNGLGSAPLHSPYYDFNDAILPMGASYFVRLIEAALP